MNRKAPTTTLAPPKRAPADQSPTAAPPSAVPVKRNVPQGRPVPEEPAQPPKSKAFEVVDAYISSSETGLGPVLQNALRDLLARAELPANPYPDLANPISAHSDQGPPWRLNETELVDELEHEGGIELADPASKLCRLKFGGAAWGLAPVLRCVTRAGLAALRATLRSSLPECIWPGCGERELPSGGVEGAEGAVPEGATVEGSTMRVLTSLQGACTTYRREYQEFPAAVELRADVAVVGGTREAAVDDFASLIARDCAELVAAGRHLIQSVVLQDARFPPPPKAAAPTALALPGTLRRDSSVQQNPSAAAAAPTNIPLSLLLGSDAAELAKVVGEGVQAGRFIVLQAVVAVESTSDRNHSSQARFIHLSKTYVLHHAPDSSAANLAQPPLASPLAKQSSTASAGSAKGAKSEGPQFDSLGASAPWEALYGGVFLERDAALAYMGLFAGISDPMSALTAHLSSVATALRRLQNDHTFPDTLSGLLLLVLCREPQVSGPPSIGVMPPLSTLLPPQLSEEALAELLSCAEKGQPPEQHVLLAVPRIFKLLFGRGAALAGLGRELGALQSVLEYYAHLGSLSLEEWVTPLQRLPGEECVLEHVAGLRACLLTAAREDWAPAFSDVILATMKGPFASAASPPEHQRPPRNAAWGLSESTSQPATSAAPFSRGYQEQKAPPQDQKVPVHELLAAVQKLRHLTALAARASFMQLLKERCPEVHTCGKWFGVDFLKPDELVERVLSASRGPEWVIDVASVADIQVKAGVIPKFMAREGVLMKYCNDTGLNNWLAGLYAGFLQPPLPRNPFPAVLRATWAAGCRFQLWDLPQDVTIKSLRNELCLLPGTAFLYSARRHARQDAAQSGALPPRRTTFDPHPERAAAGVSSGCWDDGDSASQVFGCYAAVEMADVAAVVGLQRSLPHIFRGRSLQQGAYQVDIIPALIGDASISNACRLNDPPPAPMGPLLPNSEPPPTNQPSLGPGNPLTGPSDGVAMPAVEQQGAVAKWHAVGGPQQPSAALSHPRCFQLEAEDHYLLTGPDRVAATAVFAALLWESAADLHRHSPHLLLDLQVPPLRFACSDILQQPPPQNLSRALKAAIRREAKTHADSAVAFLSLLLRTPEGEYLPCSKRAVFGFRKSRDGPALGWKLPPAEAPPGSWSDEVYSRVFFDREEASIWTSWHRHMGDPAHAVHSTAFAASMQAQAAAAERKKDHLSALKLLLHGAMAEGDAGTAAELSHALKGPAQEWANLLSMHAMLMELCEGGGLDPAASAKLEPEVLRATLERHLARLLLAAASPEHCCLHGVAITMAENVAALRGSLDRFMNLIAPSTLDPTAEEPQATKGQLPSEEGGKDVTGALHALWACMATCSSVCSRSTHECLSVVIQRMSQ